MRDRETVAGEIACSSNMHQPQQLRGIMMNNSRLQSPRDKYMNDPEYHALVCALEQHIDHARFTPSELREACMLASINYEMWHIRDRQIDPRTTEAILVLDEFVNSRPRRR